MKKTVCLLLALTFVTASFFACSGAPETTSESLTDPVTTEEVTTVEITTEEITTEEVTTEEETEPEETIPEFIVVEDEEATLTLPRTFGSHMVLQRDAEIRVFGKSNRDGAVIRGTFKEQTAYALVKNGEFTLKFAPEPASVEQAELTVEDDKGNSVKFEDVLVGDVWLISGQSNANISLLEIGGGLKKFPAFDENENMRIFMQRPDYYLDNPKLVKDPCDDFPDPKVMWKKPDKAASLEFSALGFFFGRRMSSDLGIPVGVINIAANGAQIQELMTKAAAKRVKLTTSYKVKPGGFFNGMVHPFVGISFKGMVFFQGESEGGMDSTAKKYDEYLKEYVADMKNQFGFDFAFYAIQLSSYSKASQTNFGRVNYVRFGQYQAMADMDNENLLPSYDLRSPDYYFDYMHSPKKEETADRVADLVLAKEYGIGDKNDFLAPMPEKITLSEDKTTVTVKFKNVRDGLVSKSGTESVNGFYVGTEKKLKAAEAEIVSKDTVLVHVPEDAETEKIAYAFDVVINEQNTQLYNSGNMPALAFWQDL
jgi:sialate O-acetylesterase